MITYKEPAGLSRVGLKNLILFLLRTVLTCLLLLITFSSPTLAQGGADISLTMAASPDPVRVGSFMTYSIGVANTSSFTAGTVRVSDNLPASTTFVSCATTGGGSCGGSGNNRLMIFNTMPPLSTATITLTVSVNCTTNAVVDNMATASTLTDPNLANNTATTRTTLIDRPTIICPSNIVTPTALGKATAVVEYPPPQIIGSCPGLSLNYSKPSGSEFPIGATTVTFTVSSPAGVMATCNFTVTVVDNEPPSIICPDNMVLPVPAGQSSMAVRYPLPKVSDNAPGVTFVATPSSGSIFPIGTTRVVIVAIDSSGNRATCFFNVNVVDRQPPSINCPNNITVVAQQGQSSAVVNYPAPTVTENSPNVTMVSEPASGTSFPVGTTTVTATATDPSGNRSTCSFTVTVLDKEPPSLICPVDVVVAAPTDRCVATINYPPPQASDNAPGVRVDYSIPSGSTFNVGTSRVTITATDSSGNKTTCSFNVVVTGAPRAKLTLEGGADSLEFGPATARRRIRNNLSFRLLTMENTGCMPLTMSLQAISRTGNDVLGGRIVDPNDAGLFLLRVANADGSETEWNIGEVRSLSQGGRLNMRLLFNPLIPFTAGRTQNLSASQVLPSLVTSAIDLLTTDPAVTQQGDGSMRIDLIGRVRTAVKLINPGNSERAPVVFFTRSGDRLIAELALYDSNLDVNRLSFQFLDAADRQVGQTLDVNITEPIQQSGILSGQSFGVVQEFAGANDNPDIVRVRVTVFDSESSDTVTSGQVTAAPVSPAIGPQQTFGDRLVLPVLKLTSIRQ